MKTYYRSLMAINLLMVAIAISLIINGFVYNSKISIGVGTLFLTYWTLSLIYTKKDYEKGELAAQKEEAERLELENQPTGSVYTQLNGLSKNEILWLYNHVENQKDALTQVNTARREGYVSMINTFSETKGLESLASDTQKELELWDEFYLENSNMVATILPKLELLKEAVS